MKAKSSPTQVHHHYHYAGGFNPVPFIVIGVLILSAICGFCDPSYPPNRVSRSAHGITHHALFSSQHATAWSTFWSYWWSSYWQFLNSSAIFFGWKGYGFFWAHYPSWAVVIFLGIPIVGTIGIFFLVKFLLKRTRWMMTTTLLLYAWHCGISTLLYKGAHWTSLLTCLLMVISFFLSVGLFDFLRGKIIYWITHGLSQCNNRWKFLKIFIFNHS